MKKLIKRLLYKPILHLSAKYTSKPDFKRIEASLDDIMLRIDSDNKKDVCIRDLNDGSAYIIFSDQHKGAKDGSDDFAVAEPAYLAALEYYNNAGYTLVSLGDAEELWENTWLSVKKNNKAGFNMEKRFVQRNAFIKVFGNHDVFWHHDPLAPFHSRSVYEQEVKVYEAVLLYSKTPRLKILLTHGHQGDARSDSNKFSSWFVSNIWAPLQSFLSINFNTPATDPSLKNLHNTMMYQWSAKQKDLLLITGHTHQPVFCSLTYIERLHLKLQKAMEENDSGQIIYLQNTIKQTWGRETPQLLDDLHVIPSYFNSGCCCYSDGDITGIEITASHIRLVKWTTINVEKPLRIVLEEAMLQNIATAIKETFSLAGKVP